MKENAILIDFGFHYKQMIHASYFWNQYKLKTITRSDKGIEIEAGNFNEIVSATDKFLTLKIILFCFFNASNSEKIIVLTGPEYGDSFRAQIIRFFWFVFCVIFRRKVTIYVKNTSAYRNYKFLKKTCFWVDKCLFESELQRDFFLSKVNVKRNKTGIVYVYYPDILEKKTGQNKNFISILIS